MTEYTKEDDYTLLAINKVPSGGTLCRYFNFAAGQVTTIFVQRAELKDKDYKWRDNSDGGNAVSVSVSTALTSQMQVQNFSALDNTAELELMHKILKEQGGNPPDLDSRLTGKIDKPSKGPLE